VPQLALNPCAVDGGKKVHSVVGAVPVSVVAPSAGAVPPEISVVVPAPPTAGCVQVVTKVNTVEEVAVAVVPIVALVYGALVLFSKNIVVGEPVSAYHPVAVDNVVCVPPDPPIRVVPV
jgi:hypothetical protein